MRSGAKFKRLWPSDLHKPTPGSRRRWPWLRREADEADLSSAKCREEESRESRACIFRTNLAFNSAVDCNKRRWRRHHHSPGCRLRRVLSAFETSRVGPTVKANSSGRSGWVRRQETYIQGHCCSERFSLFILAALGPSHVLGEGRQVGPDSLGPFFHVFCLQKKGKNLQSRPYSCW